MIVIVTTRGHEGTMESPARGTFGVPVPDIRTTHYERLFRSWWVPRATYVLTDFERLSPWELQRASGLYRALRAAGLRVLNDPARAMSRVELLTHLAARGINPFAVHRADACPRPGRFPVFLREETGHMRPAADLIADQPALEAALAAQQTRGMPLRGLLVVEQAAEPYAEGLWAKWGTWRIGDALVVEHIGVDDTWMVKTGDHAKVTEAIARDEHDAVVQNRFATELAPIFDLAALEYGRADHGHFGGRPVVYEINSNPYLGYFAATPLPLRTETRRIARRRLSEAFAAIDTPAGGIVRLPGRRVRRPGSWWRPGFVGPRRP